MINIYIYSYLHSEVFTLHQFRKQIHRDISVSSRAEKKNPVKKVRIREKGQEKIL